MRKKKEAPPKRSEIWFVVENASKVMAALMATKSIMVANESDGVAKDAVILTQRLYHELKSWGFFEE